MRTVIILFVFSLIFLSLICSCTKTNIQPTQNTNQATKNETEKTTPKEDKPERRVLNYQTVKAIWISQFDLFNVYTENGTQRSIESFSEKINIILQNVKDLGFNTVFLQVRPNCDSMYPSALFPPSRYVTGAYGRRFEYDPIEIMIEKCHTLNLSVHGWINPLRCMSDSEITLIDDKYTVKQFYNNKDKNGKYIVEVNGRLYLNPAYEEVRNYITNGIIEMISLYSFDGCHMDDYFYPTKETFFDLEAFTEYQNNNGSSTLEEFRYENLNALVKGIYSAIKAIDKRLMFGISPQGNMKSVLENDYADVVEWCSKEGYIDYICPQIYFGFMHSTHPFDEVCKMWESIVTSEAVDLVIGLTLGKAHAEYDQWAGNGAYEWKYNKDIIKKSIAFSKTLKKFNGLSFFCYQYFFDPLTNKEISQTKSEIQNFLPELKNIIDNADIYW